MKRSGSTGGRGFAGWVAMVLAVALLVGPALREPTQYAVAQTNPAPAAKSVLDTSGIKIIQEIPIGKSEYYYRKESVDKFIEDFGEEAKDLYNLIPLELILDSIANLAVMQMGLAGREEFDVYRDEERLPEGTFGWVLQEILGIDPKRDFGLSVEHTELRETALGKKDWYELSINVRTIELILTDAFAGHEWGVRGLVLSEDKRSPKGSIYTEEKELALEQVKDGQNPGKYIFGATYTVRTRAPDGRLISLEQWQFVQGNPNAVWHDTKGTP